MEKMRALQWFWGLFGSRPPVEPIKRGDGDTIKITLERAEDSARDGHWGAARRMITTAQEAARTRGQDITERIRAIEKTFYTEGITTIAREAERGFPHRDLSEVETVIGYIESGTQQRDYVIDPNEFTIIKEGAYTKIIGTDGRGCCRDIIRSTIESRLEIYIKKAIGFLEKRESFAKRIGKEVPKEKQMSERAAVAHAIETAYLHEIKEDRQNNRSYRAVIKAADAEAYINQLKEKTRKTFDNGVREATAQAIEDLYQGVKKGWVTDRGEILTFLSQITNYTRRYGIALDPVKMSEIRESLRRI